MATQSGAKSFALIILSLVTLQLLSACIPLVLTAATVTVIDVTLDRRTAGKYWDDNALEVKVRRAIGNDAAIGSGINVSVTVFNGIVLLTGEAHNDDQRQRVEQLAKGYEETRKVVNELELAGKTNLSSRLNDAWITGKVKTRLLKLSEPPPSAVKVVTEHGKVYLLGRVTRAETEAVVETIRGISGVTYIVKVFEYLD